MFFSSGSSETSRTKKIIAAIISDLLEMPRESIRSIAINNVELAPEYLDQKFSRLDLKMDVDGRIVNIEMQVNRETDFEDRTLFYWAKLYSEELGAGEEYHTLKQTICINIINFNMFDCEDYHSHFRVLERERHELLTDKFAIHFFELRKLGKCRKNKRMEDWFNLINAETEGELMELQQKTDIPEVKDTIVMLRQLSADEKVRQEAFYREKQLHDEASALGSARREGIAEGREIKRNALAAIYTKRHSFSLITRNENTNKQKKTRSDNQIGSNLILLKYNIPCPRRQYRI